MKTTIQKAKLLTILKENKSNHKKLFLMAVDGFKKEAIGRLENKAEEIKLGKLDSVLIHLMFPENHEEDYDRAIKMVEMNTETKILLSEDEFSTLVMDDWKWKQNWLMTNQIYTSTAQGDKDA